MFNIEEQLKMLPDKPGVYIMHDIDDKIIYVGKAVNLKNRVRSYFRKTDKTERIKRMVSLIDHFEYIVVDNEAEALILECNLIKKNRPKFNVLLKDDKTYPYIKIDVKSDYPNVIITRKIVNDGSKYFGPYANPGAAKEMLDFIKQKYKIRQCKKFRSETRPCLNYHINRCLAPCMGYISTEDYRKIIDEIIDLLDGKIEKISKELDKQMLEAAANMEYEKAASIRDRKLAILRVNEKQKVSNITENNIDVIGIAKSEMEVCIEIFFVRGSKMVGREHYFFSDLKEMENQEIISGFIKQYYMDSLNLPNKIMVGEELEDKNYEYMMFGEESDYLVYSNKPYSEPNIVICTTLVKQYSELLTRANIENRISVDEKGHYYLIFKDDVGTEHITDITRDLKNIQFKCSTSHFGIGTISKSNLREIDIRINYISKSRGYSNDYWHMVKDRLKRISYIYMCIPIINVGKQYDKPIGRL